LQTSIVTCGSCCERCAPSFRGIRLEANHQIQVLTSLFFRNRRASDR
jgi:hypothetical protein